MRSGTHPGAFQMQNQFQIDSLTAAPSPRQRFGLRFRDQNATKSIEISIKFYVKFWYWIFNRFWLNFELFLTLFLIKMNIKVKKGDFTKMSVSPTRNTHFHDFGTCFCDWKSIKKSIKKRKGFRNIFLINFALFSPPFWSQKALKNETKIW